MITIVPNKRDHSPSGSPGDPSLHSAHSPDHKKYWWAKLFTYIHGASLRAGNKTLPGEIRGRLLKISYARTQKNGRVGAEHNLYALAVTHPVH